MLYEVQPAPVHLPVPGDVCHYTMGAVGFVSILPWKKIKNKKERVYWVFALQGNCLLLECFNGNCLGLQQLQVSKCRCALFLQWDWVGWDGMSWNRIDDMAWEELGWDGMGWWQSLTQNQPSLLDFPFLECPGAAGLEKVWGPLVKPFGCDSDGGAFSPAWDLNLNRKPQRTEEKQSLLPPLPAG